MTAPVRVQRKRAKGWKMPANTVYVGRPGRFGNVFREADAVRSGHANKATWRIFDVQRFRDWIGPTQQGRDLWQGPESDKRRQAILDGLPALRGKNLACWCALDQPCHADVLLEIANREI